MPHDKRPVHVAAGRQKAFACRAAVSAKAGSTEEEAQAKAASGVAISRAEQLMLAAKA